MPTTAPIAVASSVAATAMSSDSRPPQASRANTSRKMRSAPSGNAALGPTGMPCPARRRARSRSRSGPCCATSGPSSREERRAAPRSRAPTTRRAVPARTARAPARRARLSSLAVREERRHGARERLGALLGGRRAAVEHLEARAAAARAPAGGPARRGDARFVRPQATSVGAVTRGTLAVSGPRVEHRAASWRTLPRARPGRRRSRTGDRRGASGAARANRGRGRACARRAA